ncbi:hypothetical protein [Terribacillus sp. DMT04]|uniref:hypothetical protein n=1 Tax=Terribacillus sp. DMT04 TaxID=2850441 RepID=UPI001C2BDA98|nr:hypothetical protein [Terribacillus sp. DMT04]QXE03533.1 hypothetical protein KS242_17805 [Terribacillus sp. DMT04]
MKKVLLAIGDATYSKILRNHLSTHEDDFEVIDSEVMHHRYLDEFIIAEQPDILILHDYYLPNDFKSSDREWIETVYRIREQFNDKVRVVFLCERENSDPFLTNLVAYHVLDIFNKNSIDLDAMINQLKNEPLFSNVSRFMNTAAEVAKVDIPAPTVLEKKPEQEDVVDTEPLKEVEEPPPQKPKKEKREKPEKPIVQKQVIKRNYQIQLSEQVEKVVGIPVERKTVLVISPFARSGSTFFSHIVSRQLAMLGVSTTYMENPFQPSYTWDRFNGHNLKPNYRSKYFQQITEYELDSEQVEDWIFRDVNLLVKNPAAEKEYDEQYFGFDNYIKMLFASTATVTIIDAGADWAKPVYRELFSVASHVFCVVEPDLSNLQNIFDENDLQKSLLFEMANDDKFHLIGNRFSNGFDKELIELANQALDLDFTTCIPEFSSQDVFMSQTKGEFLNDSRKNRESIEKALAPVLELLLPKEFRKKQKGSSLMGRLMNKKIKIVTNEN